MPERRHATWVPDSELSHEQIVARNLAAVQAHFHNENPNDVDKAIGLYTDDIVWEAPARGQIYRDAETVRRAYLSIFETIRLHGYVPLRRFATERFVFDDHISDETVVGDPSGIPHLPFAKGSRMSTRMAHVFEMRDGRIAREIAFELWRQKGGAIDNDCIPDGASYIAYE